MLKYKTAPKSTIRLNRLEDLSIEELYTYIDEYNYVCIKGLFDVSRLKHSIAKLRSLYSANNDNPSIGEERHEIRNNFQKLTLGGASLRYNNYARFFRTFYNPTWADDIYGMRSVFKDLIRLRNKIYDIDQDFAISKIEDNGLWSATRIHQYPSGGGFFCVHRDTTLLDVAKEKKSNFYQIILNLNQKGVDYNSGGAFVDNDQYRFMVEDQCEIGDVLVYDGRTLHGVEEVDPNSVINMNNINGRLVAMASLYKV